MKRKEVFDELKKIDDPVKDYAKILSNLHYTHFNLMDKYKKILAEYDLTLPQSNVLGIIDHFFPKSASLEEIKEMVLEPNADVSRMVTRLAEKGFVKKVIDTKNRRKVSIIITAIGNSVLKKMFEDGRFQKFTSSISKKEALTFTAVLEKLRQS